MPGYKVNGVDLDTIFAPLQPGWPQAGVTEFEIAGVDLNARYAPLVTGTAAPITDYRTSGPEDLNGIFAAFGSTGVQVLTQPHNVVGAAAAGNPAGTVTTNTTTCAGTKGKGTYTYAWHIASGSGVTFTNPNSPTTAVTGSVPAASSINGTMYCTISDGTTSVNTNVVTWSLQNTSPQIVVIPYTVFNQETLPKDAGAAVYFFPDGTEQIQTALNPNVTIGYWDPAGDGINYDVMATLVSGDYVDNKSSPAYQDLNIWYSLNGPAWIAWGIRNGSGTGNTVTCTIEVSIRLHSSGLVLATGNITLSAESDSNN